MSNPFTSVSVTNYNVSPPDDDASQVSGNQLQWSKHKTKLGDPLKTAIESINTNAVNAFANRLGTTFETKSANYPIAAPGDQGKFFSVTGTTTMSLPAVVDAGDGFPVAIFNTGSGVVTVDGNASETINGSVSITLAPGVGILITTDGSSWAGLILNLDFSGLTAITAAGLAATDGILVDDAGVPKRIAVQELGLRVQTGQGTQELAADDMNTIMEFTATSILTIPLNSATPLPIGVPVVFNVKHATQVLTVTAAASVTLVSVFHPGGVSAASDNLRAGGSAILYQTATDVWALSGDIVDA